jgi:hypothetical protein
MTSATSVLGLLPLAVGWSLHYDWPPTIAVGEAVELRAPLAIAVMGGLCSSTVLVLLSLPSVLLLVARERALPAAPPQAPSAALPAAAPAAPRDTSAQQPDLAPGEPPAAQHAPGG